MDRQTDRHNRCALGLLVTNQIILKPRSVQFSAKTKNKNAFSFFVFVVLPSNCEAKCSQKQKRVFVLEFAFSLQSVKQKPKTRHIMVPSCCLLKLRVLRQRIDIFWFNPFSLVWSFSMTIAQHAMAITNWKDLTCFARISTFLLFSDSKVHSFMQATSCLSLQ